MTILEQGRFKLKYVDESIELMPTGALYWPSRHTLIVADLHLGKGTTFQRNGIPIPDGTDQVTLQKLQSDIEATRARDILILGDFIHARIGWNATLVDKLNGFFHGNPDTRWQLVLGNHDRGSLSRFGQFPIELFRAPYVVEPFTFFHELPDQEELVEREFQAFMAGHIHPCISIRDSERIGARLKCFWCQANGLVLPAYGEFTGSHRIEPRSQDRVIGIVEKELIDVTDLVSRGAPRHVKKWESSDRS